MQVPLLCEKTGALALVQLAGRQNAIKFRDFKNI